MNCEVGQEINYIYGDLVITMYRYSTMNTQSYMRAELKQKIGVTDRDE